MSDPVLVLAGDIGATKSLVALVEVQGAEWTTLREEWYPSAEFTGLEPLLHDFLVRGAECPTTACFGLACPITGAECRFPNLPWVVRRSSVAAALGLPGVHLINDFEAIGYALSRLGPSDTEALQVGSPATHGAIALLGAGTGLGMAFLTWEDGDYRVHPSEGGHAGFAPADGLQQRLLASLSAREGPVVCESVLSGRGIVATYEFLRDAEGEAEAARVRDVIAANEDPAVVITEFGVQGRDPLCRRTLQVFARAYGAEAGNWALRVMARGGVYIAGGIALRILPVLRAGGFIEAFNAKGDYEPLLRTMPVQVITNPRVGLIGAVAAATVAR